MRVRRIVVIGGGAAGFFAAIAAREQAPSVQVVLLEAGSKVLSKVRISGGGRCNVTHACSSVSELVRNYPRGATFLRKVFPNWAVRETMHWFEQLGARLKVETDGRVFPMSDDSETICGVLEREATDRGVELRLNTRMRALRKEGDAWVIGLDGGGSLPADRVIICTGGSPKADGLAWLVHLGQPVVPPVPSLFTFNLKEPLRHLMGVVAPAAGIRIEGIDMRSAGPVLITHWGFSGPAVLKLSAWCARELHARGYRYTLRVDWMGVKEEVVRAMLDASWAGSPKKQVINAPLDGLPVRLWEHLIDRAGIPSTKPCGEVGRRDRNRLVDVLVNDRYEAVGKTTFKEEFVTAGGVDLAQVDPNTMESRLLPGLHYAGEVLDIDGVTGGFNFQAAWSTGRSAGLNAAAALSTP